MENKIMFSGELMEALNYRSASAFNRFFNKDESFPKPFKVGIRNAWYREDINNWLETKRAAANAH